MRLVYIPVLLFGTICFVYSMDCQGQNDQSIFRRLFDQSELVIQGLVISSNCFETEMGVESCTFFIQVDSIFKGKVSENELIEIVAPLVDRSTPKSQIISFSDRCFYYLIPGFSNGLSSYFEDNCIVKGKDYIVFLKRQEVRLSTENESLKKNFRLADLWLGFQPANSYMAIELRSFND